MATLSASDEDALEVSDDLEVMSQNSSEDKSGKRQKRGAAYDHTKFLRNEKPQGTAKSYEIRKCLYCPRSFSFKGATTSFMRHLTKDHKTKLTQVAKKQSPPIESGPMGQYLATGSLPTGFSQKAFLGFIAQLVVVHDLPFSMTDWHEFKQFVNFLRPGTHVPCRATLKKEITDLYNAEKAKRKTRFGQISSKISLTCDAWTARNQDQFVGISAHYIDNEWVLRKELLGFSLLEGEHSGEKLAAVLHEHIVDFNLENKILSITTDNASNNNTMMEELDHLTKDWEFPIQREWSHVRCLAHVINLCAKAILYQLKPGTRERENTDIDEQEGGDDESEAGNSALQKLAIQVMKMQGVAK